MQAEALTRKAGTQRRYAAGRPGDVSSRWHQGVVGILASRIKERFHRPVIAFAPAGMAR
jgi:single-stranded-DNA-specific exonuclease